MKKTMTREEAVNKIMTSNGKFTAVIFKKRSDGSIRRMAFRMGVTAYLKGGERAYDASQHNLITVFDIGVKDYRSIPIEGLQRIKVAGEWIKVL